MYFRSDYDNGIFVANTDDEQDDESGQTTSGSRLAPSIAPRRRGRPARVHPALRSQETRQKVRSKPVDPGPRQRQRQQKKSRLAKKINAGSETNANPDTETTAIAISKVLPTPKRPLTHQERATARSLKDAARLVRETVAEMLTPVPAPALAPVPTATQDQTDVEMAHLGDNVVADTGPILTTEQIISQLTHDEQDLHDLLRSHAQAEFQAQQASGVMTHPLQFTYQIIQAAAASAVASTSAGVGSSNIDRPESSTNNADHGDDNDDEVEIDPGLVQALSQQPQDTEPIAFGTGPYGSCDICSRTETTVWRKLRLPDRDLHVCNREYENTNSTSGDLKSEYTNTDLNV